MRSVLVRVHLVCLSTFIVQFDRRATPIPRPSPLMIFSYLVDYIHNLLDR